MARSKNSPALFEVIRNAQQKQKELLERQQQQKLNAELHAQSPAAALLRSPLYWFKGKQAHEAAIAGQPVMREVPATPAASPTPFAAAPRTVRQPQQIAPTAVEPIFAAPDIMPAHFDEPHHVESSAVASPAAEEVVTPQAPLFGAASYEATAPSYAPTPMSAAPLSAAALAARQVRDEIAAQEAPAAEPLFGAPSYGRTSISSPFGLDTDVDEPGPRQFAIQLNYTSAAIAGFALLVAIAVAVIISTAGKKDEKVTVAKNPVRPDVLIVQKNPQNPSNITPIAPSNTVVDDGLASMTAGGESIGLDGIGKPIPVPTNVKRVVGYQYLVLLSFPREEDAKELVKYLAQNGVPATAEKALPDYAKSWTSVVTTRGFERTKNNTAFNNYSDALKALLQKYAGESKFRKTFKIDVYTWRTAR
ncbi:MAG: hypothetical protein JWM57_32 [Phycisphaerales bacterium]|nr:hypothetical protein [Phycisphaerales bacterium]